MSPELAALVVHDLKNELGALEASLERLAHVHPHSEPAQQSRHLCSELRQRFVQFLALYGRNGNLYVHAIDESPAELLAAVRANACRGRPDLRIRVVHDASVSSPTFWFMDQRLVRMALDAAMHNALRFASSEVQLSAFVDQHWLVFRIDDDGPGPSALAPEGPHATGLGTALCHAVAQAHRSGGQAGNVSLSHRPGGGARFELRLA